MSANIGYLFTKDFYRDDNAREVDRLTDSVIVKKVNDILEANPFEKNSPRRLCLPCRMPVADRPRTEQTNQDAEGEVDWEEARRRLATRRPARGQQAPIAPPAPRLPNERTVLRDYGITLIQMKVIFPGLYAGMGYLHGQDSDEDIKTGFSFDYTTGLPYLPGSGVKGALRACFTDRTEDTLEALNEQFQDRGALVSRDTLERLERKLFGNRIKGSNERAAMGHVIFYDAFPGKADGTLMARDYITPHKDPLGDPGPIIKTIKVKPGVTFDFFFKIPDIVLEAQAETNQPAVEKRHVKELFSTLLVDWGAGAKTNVGYGNLAKV